MWVVYNLKSYEKRFEGTPDECLAFIDKLPGKWENPIDVCSKSLYDKLYIPKINTVNENIQTPTLILNSANI